MSIAGKPIEFNAKTETILSLESIKGFVEIIGKIIIGLFAVFYAVGLMVVNIYLNNFGVYSLSLFRLNYITAGIWAIVPIIISLVLIFSIGFITIISSEKARKFLEGFNISVNLNNEPHALNWVVVAGLIATVILLSLLMYSIAQKDVVLNFLASLGTGSLFVISCSAPVLYGLESSHLFSRFARIALLILLVGGVFIFHIKFFATDVYGKIPSFLGGGSPKKAQLILDEESKIKDQLERLGVVFESDSRLTVNVQIVLATDEEYILLIETKNFGGDYKFKGLTLSKDKIQAVLFEEAMFRGTGTSGSY